MEISPTGLALLGLLLAAWTVAAGWLMIHAGAKARGAEGSRKAARRLARMIEEAPAIPMLVRTDGRIEASEKLSSWLGLPQMPDFLSELSGGNTGENAGGISKEQLQELEQAIRLAQKTANPFRLTVIPPGSRRSLALRGALADPQISPNGAVLVWIFDFSESESELTRLREEAQRAKGDFGALVGLIEAAPMPMWFRGGDSALTLVNRAYVDAVGANSAEQVVEQQIELVETVGGKTAAQVARQASAEEKPIERIIAATIEGQRRSMRVSDLPLGEEGVAGYAVDIEEMEEQSRQFRAFREAQRSMLDQLSIGVAQFDDNRRLSFANQPYRRIFGLNSSVASQGLEFERLLSNARESGRIPEVRDFPAWRAEHTAWFSSGGTHEEAWPLSDGTHLRVVAQPMPDGGLVMIAEDRTEQLALSATRDTMHRTHTATFDSLFEALAVFAPDGHLQQWNRSFAGTWGLETEGLDAHPSAPKLLEAIAPNLKHPKQTKAIGEVIRAATLDRKEQGGRIALADGRTLEFAGVPLPDGNGLLTVLDITASEQAETALLERNKALEAADDVKTRFLTNMSYELRTPLTSIGGFAELLQIGVAGELSDQGKEYIEAILESVERLSTQVENVLDLSQSEAGLLPISKKETKILPFVTGVVRAKEKAILQAGVSLDLQGKKSIGSCNIDARQLGKAVGQLLDNAIAVSPEGGKIKVRLSRESANVGASNEAGQGDGGRLSISITDNGPGMDEQELFRIMQGQGNERQGLGLPLARQLIESHGGSLHIESQKGAGTTAFIIVP